MHKHRYRKSQLLQDYLAYIEFKFHLSLYYSKSQQKNLEFFKFSSNLD